MGECIATGLTFPLSSIQWHSYKYPHRIGRPSAAHKKGHVANCIMDALYTVLACWQVESIVVLWERSYMHCKLH